MNVRLHSNSFLVVGRAGMDLYADPPGTLAEEAVRFTSALGGSAANIAAGIVKLGGAATLLTTVSDDAVGRFVLRELERYGVERTHVRTVGGQLRTSLARNGGDARVLHIADVLDEAYGGEKTGRAFHEVTKQ